MCPDSYERDELDILQDMPLRYEDLSRRDIRSLIFHLLYAAEGCDYSTTTDTLFDSFNRGFHLEIPLDSDIYTIAGAVIENRTELDTYYETLFANWRPDRVSVCARLILRLGVWELINTDIDSRIIINEAIELAKCFAEPDAYRFINGLLDRVVKEGIIPGRSTEGADESATESE